jgi:phosphatidylglycerophosphatase A
MKKRYSLNHILNAKKIKFKVPFSWYSVISTWFYVGKLPAPGTCGSIAVYPLYYFIVMHSNSLNNTKSKLLLAIITFCIIGSFAINKFQKTTNTYDHSYIVIDEVIGQLLTLYISLEWIYNLIKKIPFFINISTSTLIFLIALIPFRYFDIKKPLIIDYVNRKYKGAFGVIFDDVLAAIFASITIYVINLIVNLFI